MSIAVGEPETGDLTYDRNTMRAYVLAVGDELLGHTRSDTNSLWLAGQFASRGVSLAGKAVAGDDRASIARALRSAMAEAPLVIVTGGLGPTSDDLTREGVSDALGVRLQHDDTVAQTIEDRFRDLGVRMAEVNLRQALVPEGAGVLPNPRGTAPGLWLETEQAQVVLLPGVPHEMQGLVEEHLLPWLESQPGRETSEVQVFRVAGLPEATVEERLAALYEQVGRDRVAVLARPGDVRVEVRSGPGQSAVEWEWMRQIMGDGLYSRGASLERTVIEGCNERGLTLAIAESCTGGGVCDRLTSVAGASAVLMGGVVAYDNSAKRNLLGVSPGALDAHGAVSERVAVEMAEGVRARFGAHMGAAVTGIAGPSGGSPEKPVGTVWFAWGVATETDTARVRFPGDRSRVRAFAVQWALDGIRRRLAAP